MNGKPGDDPLADIITYNRSVYSRRADALVREVAALADDRQRRELGDLLYGEFSPHGTPDVDRLERVLLQWRDRLRQDAAKRGWDLKPDGSLVLGRDLVQPSTTRAPEYDSTRDSPNAVYRLRCAACGSPRPIAFGELANRGADYARTFDPAIAAAALTHFGVGIVGKSHDGGWPALLDVRCPKCGTAYIVYAGVREPSNGRVLITVQGVVERILEPPAG